ncbi:MAG: response regulator [Limisphaerales bacterium]
MESGLPILLVEDNPDDVILFRRAFEKMNLPNALYAVHSGDEAVQYLQGNGQYSDREQSPFPGVIFMSLARPDPDAFQVLEWLRKHPECNVIPAIIFSAIDRDQEVKRAFTLGVHGYFEKPCELDELARNLKRIYDYWSLSTKPKTPDRC